MNDEAYEVDIALQETSGYDTELTSTEGEAITLADLEAIRDDLVHTDLFGSFLICGCIVSLALFRRFK